MSYVEKNMKRIIGKKSKLDSSKVKIKEGPIQKKSKHIIPSQNKGELIFEDFPSFCPNRTPKQILQAGSFGGTYFRPIYSSVSKTKHKDCWKEFPKDWFDGLKITLQVASPTYDKLVNKYKAKCGASLDEWESKGWIKAQDPYGWFQWYCRFYNGRRTEDDERQINRWHKFLARFKNNIVNKIKKANTTYDDYTISPAIRQSLLHWGYELVPEDLQNRKATVDKGNKTNDINVPLI